MKKKAKCVRKNFTLRPSVVVGLERLARDMDVSMSRVIEAALSALADKRTRERTPSDAPRTWAEADQLLASLPNKADLEKKS